MNGQIVRQHVPEYKRDLKEISFLEIKIKEIVVRNDVHIGVNGIRGHFVIRLVEAESKQDSEHASGRDKPIKSRL